MVPPGRIELKASTLVPPPDPKGLEATDLTGEGTSLSAGFGGDHAGFALPQPEAPGMVLLDPNGLGVAGVPGGEEVTFCGGLDTPGIVFPDPKGD